MTNLSATADTGLIAAPRVEGSSTRPPMWLIGSTGLLALTILVLAVAETGLKAQYLIDDEGEYISMFGLAFIAAAGAYLASQRRLASALPLVFPWLLYPIVTQGDQIIDNLSINPMRAICQVLLSAIFVTPVAVVVLATRGLLATTAGRGAGMPRWARLVPGARLIVDGRLREGAAVLSASLLAVEIWLAYLYLGALMIGTLIIMLVAVLAYGSMQESTATDQTTQRQRSERFARVVLVAGVIGSLATYVAYKNAPGAYQGSPSFFMDPSQSGTAYSLTRVALPTLPVSAAASPDLVRAAFDADARALSRLLDGYHILERNYTWDFHNELFIRNWPLVANYRTTGLALVAEGRDLRRSADERTSAALAALPAGDPFAAALEDLRGYVAFVFDRTPMLEQMSGGFERTQAGLQHAAHLYEGEAKYLSSGLTEVVKKHDHTLRAPAAAAITPRFLSAADAIYQAYADHIVGF